MFPTLLSMKKKLKTRQTRKLEAYESAHRSTQVKNSLEFNSQIIVTLM